MAQTIDTKVSSLKVDKYLNTSQEQISKSAQRLGSGLRVNSAEDDAAGLAIAERMNSVVRGLNVGLRNANDGMSMSQTAEGGLKRINDVLQHMRELALQSSNGANSSADRDNLDKQYSELNREISRIASSTRFNGESVLANEGGSIHFQLGAHPKDDDTFSVDLAGFESLSSSIGTREGSLESIEQIDVMIADVSRFTADFGAMQSRFESTINNLQLGVENQAAARGRITDADVAVETAMLASSQMQQESSTAMSAQANVTPQSVARLLG